MAEIDFESTDFGAAFKASNDATVPPTVFDKNPDILAKHKDLAEQSGLPLGTVERNAPAIKGKVDFQNTDFGQYVNTAPVLHGKLTSQYGAIYADDHENLAAQEGFLYEISRAGSNIGRAAASAIPAFNEGVFGLAEAGAGVLSRAVGQPIRDIGLLPQDPFAVAESVFAEQRQISKAVKQRWAPDPRGLGAIESGVYSGITSLAQQVPGIAASVLSGNPLPMLVSGTAVEGGQSFGAARDKSLNFWQSLDYGAGQAGIEFLTEKIPAGQLMKDLGMKSGFGRTLLNQLASEIPGEQAATFLQDLNEQINLNPEKTMGDFIESRPGAALQTLVATMVATGGQVSVAKLTEKSLDGLGKLQQKSKLKARSESTMEEYINDIVRDGHESVYVDADAFTTYFQDQGINPELAAKEILGDVTEYQQAVANGSAIKIPMAKYVTKIAPTKHNDFFAREVRREPDMMNGREADEFVTEFEKTLEPQEAAEVDQIQEQVTGKLTAIGYDQATAETLASQMARYFNAMGDREGSNPLELYNRFMDDIVGADVLPSGQVMEQAQLPETIEIDGVQRPTTNSKGQPIAANEEGVRNFWKWFGDSRAIHDDGKPLVVYHGSPVALAAEAGELKIGAEGGIFFAADTYAANHYAAASGRYNFARPGAARKAENIVPAYLSIKNPMIVDFGGKAKDRGFDSLIASAKEAGYDGLIARNIIDRPVENMDGYSPSDVYVAFRPEQIKSAIGNTGAFSPATPNILLQSATLDESTGLPLNADGTVTVYHHTSADKAAQIRKSGKLKAAAEPDVYVTTRKETDTGYGDTAVAVNVDPALLQIDDEFPDGRTDYRLSVGRPGGSVKVSFPSDNVFFQSAYHGSPYKFDKFTLDHIGSGEGAQVFGYGLYFAGNKEVAEYYRGALSGLTVDGVKASGAQTKAFSVLQDNGGDIAAAVADGARETSDASGELRDILQERQDVLESWAEEMPKLDSSGQLYKVEIPEDDSYLLWDRPLSEQPESVKKALKESEITFVDDTKDDGDVYSIADAFEKSPRTQGKFAYLRAASQLGSDKAASEYLSSLGISGIKYLDGSSRSAGEGNYNYVIFDEAAIKIAKTYYQNASMPRGFMQIKPGRKLLIGLTSARNLSTFLHESGHAYLEIMRDVVADLQGKTDLTESQQGIIKDSETLLKWLGVDSFDKIEREHHEKFARGIEAYFMEGKAPSFALRQAFARFRTWMLAIYKTVRGLNVKLNDDVRAVMDRMFATDAEIESARNEEQLIQTFTTAESMGKTAREFELYVKNINRANMDARERLEQRIIKEWMRQREQWWKEESANVAAEVEAELNAQKEYQTLSAMQAGKLPDGTETGSIKLSTDAIKALYDDKTKRRLEAKRIRKSLKKKNGRSVDPVRDDLKAMVAKWGGISRDEARAQGVDQATFNRRGWGVLPMFPVSGGMTLDALAEKMSEVGFFAGEDYTANAALDMVNDALRGDDVRTPEGHIFKADQDAARVAEEEALRSENYKLEIQQMVVDKHPEIQADGVDRLIAERALEAINAGVSTYTVDDILENDDLDAAIAALDKEIASAKLQYGEGEAVPASTSQGSDYDFGEIPFGEEAGFESSQEVDAFFGDEATQSIKVMRALRKHKVMSKDGISPDEAAMLLGYSSGARLVDMLVNLKPLKQAVTERTQQVMRERHGDLLTDSAELADAAREVVLNEYQEDVLRHELQAINELNRKAQPFLKEQSRQQREARQAGVKMMRAMPSVEMLKTIAARQIAQVKYRDLKPSVYMAAMRKAGKDAMKHLEDQNYEAAAYFKQRQMLNIELYRESMRVKEGLDKGVQFARKFTDKKIRQRLGKTDFLDQIDQILERFDFTNISLKSVDKRKSLAEFIREQEEQGIPISLPIEITDTDTRRSYKDMTAEELVGVIDGIRHIDQMSRNKDKLMKIADKMRFDEFKAKAIDVINSNSKGKRKRMLERGLPQQTAGKFVDDFFASHEKIAMQVQVMDGEDGGLLWNATIRTLNEASDNEASDKAKAAMALKELFKPYTTINSQAAARFAKASFGNIQLGIYKPEFIPEINAELTKVGRLCVAFNWGNEGNRQRLKDGYGWSDQQVAAILDPLTKEDWDFIQAVGDFVHNSYWERIKALGKRMDGVEPKEVERTPVVTKYGTYPGWYFPAKYNPDDAHTMFLEAEEQAKNLIRGKTFRSQTKHGYREARATEVHGRKLRLDFGIIFEHVNETIHDLNFHEAVMDVNRIFSDRQIKAAIIENYGEAAHKQLETALQDIAAGDVGAQTSFEKFISHISTGVSVVAMGYNFSTALIQFTGLSQSAVRIGPAWLAKGIGRFLSNPFAANKLSYLVNSKSSFMENRARTQMQDIYEIRSNMQGGNTRMMASYFYLIAKMQRMVDLPTWIGAYERYMSEGFNDADSSAMADQAVKDAQGSGYIMDQAKIMRGSQLMKLFTKFYSFFNSTYNMSVWSTRKTNFHRPKEIGVWIADMLMLWTIPVLMGEFAKELIQRAVGGGDDDEEKMLEKLFRAQLSYLFGSMIGFRELSSVISGYGYQGPAGARFFAEASKLVMQAEQGKFDAAFWKSLNQNAGMLLHYPAGQFQRTALGFDAMIEGETVNPLTLIFGPPKE